MSNPKRTVSLQVKLNNVLTDLQLSTSAENVIVDVTTGETLAERLTSLQAISGVTHEELATAINTAIDDLTANAPEAYDTLSEIATYIEEHGDVTTALNEAIGNKVDKVDGKSLSTNDFTDELKEKLESVAANGTKVSASDINGNIKVNDEELTVYTHPEGDGYQHIPAGGQDGQVLQYSSTDGKAVWVDLGTKIIVVEKDAELPENIGENELIIRLQD